MGPFQVIKDPGTVVILHARTVQAERLLSISYACYEGALLTLPLTRCIRPLPLMLPVMEGG